MKPTELRQEIRKMRFEEACYGEEEKRLHQIEWGCERTFRRYINRYEEAGLESLIDKRRNRAFFFPKVQYGGNHNRILDDSIN